MAGSDEDCGRSKKPAVEDRGWPSTGRVLSGGRSGGYVTLCAVCTVDKEMKSTDFLVWTHNQGLWFVSGLASNPLGQVSRFGPQNRQQRFGDLCLKITATFSWFGP
jgi:hypothetical protein